MSSPRRYWHHLRRQYFCSKRGHKWKLSKEGFSYGSCCRLVMK